MFFQWHCLETAELLKGLLLRYFNIAVPCFELTLEENFVLTYNHVYGFRIINQLISMIKVINLVGNAFFPKGPKVTTVNTLNVEEILKKAWFKDQDIVIKKDLKMANVTFLDNIILPVSFVISLSFLSTFPKILRDLSTISISPCCLTTT